MAIGPIDFLAGGISGGQGGISAPSSAESGGDYRASFTTGAKNIGAGGPSFAAYEFRKLVTNPFVIGGALVGVYLITRRKK